MNYYYSSAPAVLAGLIFVLTSILRCFKSPGLFRKNNPNVNLSWILLAGVALKKHCAGSVQSVLFHIKFRVLHILLNCIFYDLKTSDKEDVLSSTQCGKYGQIFPLRSQQIQKKYKYLKSRYLFLYS